MLGQDWLKRLKVKKNKEVLILGASSDIGIEVVNLFLKYNWNVYAHYNNNADKLKKILKNQKKSLFLIKSDLSNDRSVKNLIDNVKKKNIASYVNLVGYLDNKSFQNFNITDIVKTLKINTLNPLLIQRALIKKMLKLKFGRILNISSIGVKYGGSKYTFNYSFSKKALEYFPKYLKDLTRNNILNNVLRIGVVNTKLLKKVKSKNLSKRVSLIPIKRMATVVEIAKAIYNLTSDKNTYISGETITIAGGE